MILGGTNPAVTFPDGTIQNTAAVVNGSVPYSVLPTGSVLQVINATYNTQVATTTTGTLTGLTATITPKFSTSKILVLVDQAGCFNGSGTASVMFLALQRNGVTLQGFENFGGYQSANQAQDFGSCSINYLDSPATTSATTYRTIVSSSSTGSVAVQYNASVSSITLMEIAG